MKPRTSMMLLLGVVIAAMAVWHVVDERAPFRSRSAGADALAATHDPQIANGEQDATDGFAVGALGATQEQVAADVAVAAAGPATRFHPRPLSADNQQRVDAALAQLQGPDAPTSDFVKRITDRLANETPDVDWGRRVQMDLEDDFAKRASVLHNLEIADAQCAQSVCALYAVAPGDNPQAPGADWQRFMSDTFGQPQRRNQLTPQMTSVMVIDGRVVYVTFVERK
ncbi:hypothetical protein [Pseudoxanthomonas indica]|uniref:Uncharacterized protein n=1 Tax=Pseudoxanthomonas indica TaxID=428993 RepID=A0A1T5KP85_9GAMM|nr:hypothetical protein [Pseudoxanthomonas indica]SKC65473.1 hypothetical protein SAMN06296058_1879 [Pseudoxanthomonas indica]